MSAFGTRTAPPLKVAMEESRGHEGKQRVGGGAIKHRRREMILLIACLCIYGFGLDQDLYFLAVIVYAYVHHLAFHVQLEDK